MLVLAASAVAPAALARADVGARPSPVTTAEGEDGAPPALVIEELPVLDASAPHINDGLWMGWLLTLLVPYGLNLMITWPLAVTRGHEAGEWGHWMLLPQIGPWFVFASGNTPEGQATLAIVSGVGQNAFLLLMWIIELATGARSFASTPVASRHEPALRVDVSPTVGGAEARVRLHF